MSDVLVDRMHATTELESLSLIRCSQLACRNALCSPQDEDGMNSAGSAGSVDSVDRQQFSTETQQLSKYVYKHSYFCETLGI